MAHSNKAPIALKKFALLIRNHLLRFIKSDAAQLNIKDSKWVSVRSRRGKSKFPAKITRAIAPGTVFVPMHALCAVGRKFGSKRSHPSRILPRLTATRIKSLCRTTSANYQTGGGKGRQCVPLFPSS
ncbi:MAG: hypothetical protein KME31_27545 [Tolypothrix carrinoi HA7290-LM1]|nr:hypothetical protein [Tolypothrix carrinoi HA7290-LM1]